MAVDTRHEISDQLMCYDETEPADSPYMMLKRALWNGSKPSPRKK